MDPTMWNANLPYIFLGRYGDRKIRVTAPTNSNSTCFHGSLGMEAGDVCALCPQNSQHPDCNSNKCANQGVAGRAEAGGLGVDGFVVSTESEADDDRLLSESQLNSLHATTTGSSQPSSCSGSVMHDSADYQWCLDYGYNREYHNLKKFPQSILSPAFGSSIISSYDDVAKNIDANLAEIDMETFRSEDIHSILALPAIYSGELQGSRHQGEKGASVSESLMGAFELDSSVSPRSTSEDGSTSMSICKDEPLFSPLREQQIPPLGTISTDSLDCGSSFAEPDLVLTCRANKNNYTIAFEGSGPQFSDDSDYLGEVDESSGGDSGLWQDQGSREGATSGNGGYKHCAADQGNSKGRDMIQSDCVFTTWSKLRRLKETTRSYGRKTKNNGNGKSQSLPNLLRQSVIVAERAAMESSWENGKSGEKDSQNVCLPLFDIQNSQLTRSKDSEGSSNGPLSLLKLFIQHRAPGSSLDGESMCSSQSEASASTSSHQPTSECPLTVVSRDECDARKHCENNANIEKKFRLTENNQAYQTNNEVGMENDEERNNNNVLPIERVVDNLNIIGIGVTKPGEFNSESEEDSSQCFEDSLMEAHVPRSIALQASVIKEEDEPTENSSSDETMQDMKDPFLSDSGSGTSEEATITKNNSIKGLLRQSKRNDKMDRITNVFSTGKSNQHLNIACCATMDDKLLPSKQLDLVPAIQTQGTQTKLVNQRRGASGSKSPNDVTDSTESIPSSATVEIDGSVSSQSRGTSSTRVSPITAAPSSPIKKVNVSIATTRTCGTQIPVHIKDQEVQTSVMEETSSEGWSFTLKESLDTDEMEELYTLPNCVSPVERPQSPLPPTENKESKNLVENKEEDELEYDEEDEDEDDDDEKKPPEKSIYVCYPNYSLPDLSFLRALTASPESKEGAVILNPTSRRQPLRQPAQRRSYSSEGRETQGRPKSCNDFDSLSSRNFGHIRDWDSLKVLLPNDIRNIISTMRQNESESGSSCQSGSNKSGSRCGGHRHHHRHHHQSKRLMDASPNSSFSSSSGSNSSATTTGGNTTLLQKMVGPHFGVLKEVPPPIPKRSLSLPMSENNAQYPRSILRKSSSSGHCNNSAQSGLPPKCRSVPMMPWVEDAKSKRRSLQEPFHCLLDNIPEALQTSEHHPPPQPLYAMESSRIQEGGEEQPAVGPFSQGHPVHRSASAQGCFGPRHTPGANYSLSRTRSDYCCPTYRNYTQPDSTRMQGGDSSDSSEDSTSDLQKLLVSSAALNYADALLAGQAASPTQSPLSEEQPSSEEMGFLRCGCPRGKKSVSFCEEVDVKGQHHHQECGGQQGYNNAKQQCVTSPCQCTSPDMIEEIIKNSCIRSDKCGLLKRLQGAVHVVLDALNEIVDFDPKDKFSLENVVLNNVCPALHTVLADGLLPSVIGLFGPLQNSPWRLAENSCQQDQKIQELVELIAYINGESSLCNNSTKFCAFVFGLLNLKMVDQWVSKFLSCSQLIQLNYQPNALVFLMSTVPSFMAWQRDLLAMLKPLASISFQLDVLSPATAVPSTERVVPRARKPTAAQQRPFSCVEMGEKLAYPNRIPSSTSWDGAAEPIPLDENLNIEPTKEDLDVDEMKDNREKDYDLEEWDPSSEKSKEYTKGKPLPREDSPGFQELRQKWEKMANNPTAPGTTGAATGPQQLVPSMNVAASAKPPLPIGSHRTREMVKKGPVKTTVHQQQQPPKGSPIHMRSKLPSPVRANTPPNRSRPHTPESPRHIARPLPQQQTPSAAIGKGVATAAIVTGRSASPAQGLVAKTPRKSMIPVHRPPSVRNAPSTLGGKRQPVVGRHPAPKNN